MTVQSAHISFITCLVPKRDHQQATVSDSKQPTPAFLTSRLVGGEAQKNWNVVHVRCTCQDSDRMHMIGIKQSAPTSALFLIVLQVCYAQ